MIVLALACAAALLLQRALVQRTVGYASDLLVDPVARALVARSVRRLTSGAVRQLGVLVGVSLAVALLAVLIGDTHDGTADRPPVRSTRSADPSERQWCAG